MKKNLIIISLLLASLLILSACNRGGYEPYQDPTWTNYYQGTEGIRMTLDPGAPPPVLYYYSNTDHEYNSFSIDVTLENVGASYTRGGLYVSGYDPNLIYLEDINIPRTGNNWWQDCRIGLNFLSAIFGGSIGCNFGDSGFNLGGDSEGEWNLYLNNLFQIVGLDNFPEIDFGYDSTTGRTTFNFDIYGLMADGIFEGYNGISLLSIIGPLKFDRFNGIAFGVGEQYPLPPDNHMYPGGGTAVISFPGYVKGTWPPGLDSTDVTFLISSCYAYSTFATPVVCIDPQPYSMNKKACIPGMVELKGSQGAPVAVTRVWQENTPKDVIFTIEVQNVGQGDVIFPGDLELCSPYYPGRLGLESLDTVILGDIRMAGSPYRLKCTPSNNLIKLRDGRGQITCIYPMEFGTAKSAYKAPLIIELWYGYTETWREDLYIKRVT